MDSTDIRVIFLYEYKLGNNDAKAARNINKTFGKNTVNDLKAQRWFEKFRFGDFSLQNEPRGRPETSVKNDALKALVETNPTVSSRELAARMEVDHTTILRHLSEIGVVKKMDKWIPHELTKRNKLDCLNHPPYSPDLSPTDFHLFKHLELFLRAKQYENEDSLKNAISEFIDSKDQNFFKTGIYALKSR
ncbi:histone-lysine N-methyltransferase SETMAR-like [Vespa mandarinia]|uniref:histone-lysine N-methyltransferase SETMAR-like n=1 Tax=Vespa mandarinia TaxID=7446 RepID=UPI00161EB897|nr:histone-lysine N-methyltransferase SETMAR-like [Vespa mandarinia]